MPRQDEDIIAGYAAQYIAATLGVEVERFDTGGRQGAHDLRYEHEGRSVAVEVKKVLDADFRQMEGALDRLGYVRDGRLRQSWDVRLRHGARVDRARVEVPSILVLLEDTGWDEMEPWRLRMTQPHLADWMDRLGVRILWPAPPTEKHPPGFYLMPEPWGRPRVRYQRAGRIRQRVAGRRQPGDGETPPPTP